MEAVIGHMKSDGHLGRNYLQGRAGDQANAVLTAACYNFRLILSCLRLLAPDPHRRPTRARATPSRANCFLTADQTDPDLVPLEFVVAISSMWVVERALAKEQNASNEDADLGGKRPVFVHQGKHGGAVRGK